MTWNVKTWSVLRSPTWLSKAVMSRPVGLSQLPSTTISFISDVLRGHGQLYIKTSDLSFLTRIMLLVWHYYVRPRSDWLDYSLILERRLWDHGSTHTAPLRCVAFCSVLFCSVLFCNVMCRVVLCHGVLCYAVPWCVVLCCVVLWCAALCFSVLCCVVLWCAVMYRVVLSFTDRYEIIT